MLENCSKLNFFGFLLVPTEWFLSKGTRVEPLCSHPKFPCRVSRGIPELSKAYTKVFSWNKDSCN